MPDNAKKLVDSHFLETTDDRANELMQALMRIYTKGVDPTGAPIVNLKAALDGLVNATAQLCHAHPKPLRLTKDVHSEVERIVRILIQRGATQ